MIRNKSIWMQTKLEIDLLSNVPTYKIPIQYFNGIPTNPKQTGMSSLLDCNLHVHNMYIPV